MRLLPVGDDGTKIGGGGPIIRVTAAGAILTGGAQSSTAPSSFAIVTTPVDIVLAAGDVLRVQNLATAPLYVKRGTGASSSSFNYVLKAGTANDDGLGGAVVISDFIGTVSFSGTRYNAWK